MSVRTAVFSDSLRQMPSRGLSLLLTPVTAAGGLSMEHIPGLPWGKGGSHPAGMPRGFSFHPASPVWGVLPLFRHRTPHPHTPTAQRPPSDPRQSPYGAFWALSAQSPAGSRGCARAAASQRGDRVGAPFSRRRRSSEQRCARTRHPFTFPVVGFNLSPARRIFADCEPPLGGCEGPGCPSPSPPGQVEASLQPPHPNCCQQLQGHFRGFADRPECTRAIWGEQAAPPCQAGSGRPHTDTAPDPPRGTPPSPHCARLSRRAPKWDTLTQGSRHPPVSITRAEAVGPPSLAAFSPHSPAPSHQCCSHRDQTGGRAQPRSPVLPGCCPVPSLGGSRSLKGLQKSIPSN